MTPTADPTPLHIIMESAGNGDGISAGMAALIAAGISALIALFSASITQWFSNKRHEAELAERKADRLFDARREVASRCFQAIHSYRAKRKCPLFDGRVEALEELTTTIQENAGELAMLFRPEVSELARRIQTTGGVTQSRHSMKLSDYQETQKPIDYRWPSNRNKKESDVFQEFMVFVTETEHELNVLFRSFTEAVTKDLGTFQEPEWLRTK